MCKECVFFTLFLLSLLTKETRYITKNSIFNNSFILCHFHLFKFYPVASDRSIEDSSSYSSSSLKPCQFSPYEIGTRGSKSLVRVSSTRGDALRRSQASMATTPEAPDRTGPIQSLEQPIVHEDQKPIIVENLNEQPPIKEEKLASNISHDSSAVDMSRDFSGQLDSSSVGGNQNAVYPPNYGHQSQPFFFGGYDNPAVEWEEYPQILNVEGLDVGSTGIYNDNHSVIYHTGYGYSQMPYGSYSPVTTPLSGDGQLYSPQHFPFSGGFFQQPATPSMAFLSSSASLSQAELMMPVGQQGSLLSDSSNSSNVLFGPRPSYQPSYSSFGRDWLKSPDGTGSMTSSPAASPQPIGTLMSFGQSSMPFASEMVPQQQRYGFGTGFGSYDRGYPAGVYQSSAFGGSGPSFGVNGRSLISFDKSRRPGKGNSSLCSCNNTLDFLTEQNRGPRANRPKNHLAEQNSLVGENNDDSKEAVDHKLYNSQHFVTEYKDAKFFVIKSYSEDNVHKSIKYGVWASTSSGNRKLDSAYREAKERDEPCPVFLLFSVNASAQFCGVAEMAGPVDFEKNVDYWQQDKWSGQFPVKWHIVKDVPNNLFRHIILENNDNKPVTNSRDTQEVKFEQGLEMLTIFNKHEYEASILDDLAFYEEREKAMQERKARQHQQALSNSSVAVPSAVNDEQRKTAAIPGNIINQFSKTFAEAVRLDERSKGDKPTNKSSIPTTTSVPKPEDLRKPAITSVSSTS